MIWAKSGLSPGKQRYRPFEVMYGLAYRDLRPNRPKKSD